MRFGLQLSPPLSLALHARSQIPADTIPQTSTLRAPTNTSSTTTTTTTTTTAAAAAAAAAMVSALILLAEGTEESEYTITYDVLVRGGVSVRSALVPPCDGAYVTCSRGVKIVPDISLPCPAEAVREYDALIIPGGAKGAETISSSSDVHALIKHMHDAGKVVGAICAGSLAIKAAHLAPGAKITSHPSVKSQLESDYDYREEGVVVSDRLITSRGPGTTFEFALALVTTLVGASKAQEIAPPMLLPSV